jgi:hypothetical protein
MKIQKRFSLSIFLVFILLFTTSIWGQRRDPVKTLVKGDTLYTLLKPGDIPAIFEPEFIPVNESDSTYFDNEPLIVVVDGNEAKGYSIWHLDQHEIVNDYINGKAITVTW